MSPKKKYPREYRAWRDMHTRCNNPNFIGYAMYMGRGITIDPRWENFEFFIADMRLCPKGYWLDRSDNNLGYGPNNCRWASPKEQARNTRRNVFLTVNGERLTVAEWSERTGISKYTIYTRQKAGFSDDACLVSPGDRKHYATFGGETLPLIEWSNRLGVNVDTIRIRLKRWPLEKALTTSKLHNGGRRPLGMSQHCESLGS